jgi:hypothetical protein
MACPNSPPLELECQSSLCVQWEDKYPPSFSLFNQCYTSQTYTQQNGIIRFLSHSTEVDQGPDNPKGRERGWCYVVSLCGQSGMKLLK